MDLPRERGSDNYPDIYSWILLLVSFHPVVTAWVGQVHTFFEAIRYLHLEGVHDEEILCSWRFDQYLVELIEEH